MARDFLSVYLVCIVTITSAHIITTIAKALLDFAFCHANRTDVPPLSNIKKTNILRRPTVMQFYCKTISDMYIG